MNLNELLAIFEEVKWAIGSDVKHATMLSQRDQVDSDYTIVWVNIDDLFAKTSPGQQIDIKTGAGEIKGRIPRAKKFWSDEGFMDPPRVAYNEYTDDFVFTDGRHRLIAAYQLGERYAPVLFPTEQLDLVRQRLKTK